MSKNAVKILEDYYKANFDKLVNRQSRRAGTPWNAEDVVQEAFTKALKHIDKYNVDVPFEGWFVTILNNTMRDYKRDERNYGMGLEINEDLHIDESEADKERVDMSSRLLDQMSMFRRPAKDVLYLHYVKQYKPGEIEAVLGVKPATSVKIVQRFKKQMIAMFGEVEVV